VWPMGFGGYLPRGRSCDAIVPSGWSLVVGVVWLMVSEVADPARREAFRGLVGLAILLWLKAGDIVGE